MTRSKLMLIKKIKIKALRTDRKGPAGENVIRHLTDVKT